MSQLNRQTTSSVNKFTSQGDYAFDATGHTPFLLPNQRCQSNDKSFRKLITSRKNHLLSSSFLNSLDDLWVKGPCSHHTNTPTSVCKAQHTQTIPLMLILIAKLHTHRQLTNIIRFQIRWYYYLEIFHESYSTGLVNKYVDLWLRVFSVGQLQLNSGQIRHCKIQLMRCCTADKHLNELSNTYV